MWSFSWMGYVCLPVAVLMELIFAYEVRRYNVIDTCIHVFASIQIMVAFVLALALSGGGTSAIVLVQLAPVYTMLRSVGHTYYYGILTVDGRGESFVVSGTLLGLLLIPVAVITGFTSSSTPPLSTPVALATVVLSITGLVGNITGRVATHYASYKGIKTSDKKDDKCDDDVLCAITLLHDVALTCVSVISVIYSTGLSKFDGTLTAVGILTIDTTCICGWFGHKYASREKTVESQHK